MISANDIKGEMYTTVCVESVTDLLSDQPAMRKRWSWVWPHSRTRRGPSLPFSCSGLVLLATLSPLQCELWLHTQTHNLLCVYRMCRKLWIGWYLVRAIIMFFKAICIVVFCRDSELKMNNRIPFSKMKERFPYALFTRLPCLSRGEGIYTSVCETKGQRKILGEEGEGEKKGREICKSFCVQLAIGKSTVTPLYCS